MRREAINTTDAWRIHGPRATQRRALATVHGEGLVYTTILGPSDAPPPDCSFFVFALKDVTSTTHRPLRVLRLSYRRNRRRFGSPWVGPIDAALKRLKASHCHLRCDLNLARLSLSSGGFRTPFSLFPHLRGHKRAIPPLHAKVFVCKEGIRWPKTSPRKPFSFSPNFSLKTAKFCGDREISERTCT